MGGDHRDGVPYLATSSLCLSNLPHCEGLAKVSPYRVDPESKAWHRGSRFYRLGSHALYMAGSFVYLSGAFRLDFVQEAFGAFGLVVGLLLGGSAWTNIRERYMLETRAKEGLNPEGEQL